MRRSRRERLVELLDATGAVSGLLGARRIVRVPWLTILTYHRVLRTEDAALLDEAVVDASPDQFDRQVGELARHFSIIGVDELSAWLRGGRLPKNPALITFDDGYVDNLTEALPILQRHGARAIFFVATSYVEERRLFWWDRIAFTLKHSRVGRVDLRYPEPIALDLAAEPAASKTLLLEIVRKRRGLDLPRFLDEVSRACEVPWDRDRERELASRALMTWDQVRELRRAGMDVESHTRTHRILGTLDDAALTDELVGSRADLRRELDYAPRAVAYPVGYRISAPIRRAVEAAGYEMGFTNETGVTHTFAQPDRFDLNRVCMDAEVDDRFFRGILALPQLAWTRE